MQRSQEIENRTRDFYAGLKRGDAASVADLFSREEGVLLIGTDPEEYWPGYDTISKIWEAQLGEVGSIEVEGADPQGYASGDVGWVADRPTLVLGGGEMRIPLRITGVYRRENGTWKLAQWHASIGVGNVDAGFGDVTTQADETG